MEIRSLGRTGLKVSVMGFGTGGPSRVGQRTGTGEFESIAIIQNAVRQGINIFDTAEEYGTEEILGKAIKGVDRKSLVLATKKWVWKDIEQDDVRKGLEDSLRRLGTDYVDIYYLHGVAASQYDYLASEIVPLLQKVRDEGLIRFLGISENFTKDPQHVMLQRALQDDVWDVMMAGFNILNQSARERVYPKTIEKNIGVVNMYAVRLGLTRLERLKQLVDELITGGQLDPAEVDINDPLGFLVSEGGALNMTDAGYRFCRDEPGQHVILSGTGNPEHLQANVESFGRPPMSPTATEKLKRLFKDVDSVSGQ